MRTLPPIKSIIYFESVARFQSFKLAAVEQNVTPGAVSHQINKLEDFIGKSLFSRGNRQIQLTSYGLRYYSRISIILKNIEEATIDLGIEGKRPNIRLAVPPSLLKNWLLPVLMDDAKSNISSNIEFVDTLDYLDFSKSDLDLAIRYGYDTWENMYSVHLFDEIMIPVCHPDYLKDKGHHFDQETIDNSTLIYTNNRLVQWDIVLQRLNLLSNNLTQQKLTFQNSIQSIEAAMQGGGIAYVNSILVQKELNNGRLIKPFDIKIPDHKSPSYHLVTTYEKMKNESTAKMYYTILEHCKKNT
ncbi:LysR substrate-binding domain-containing protein [Shewanella schlegeliana]|uniref:LysR family transcriptional regulator n=1 Tax=Shewanella schlegeliana TaxID=190308 RepID=A0ABS1T0K6_9GAMM|nr:LysR substrate-binding domain-containing protein [Shewanella schlegeliana]MBL4914110.1 LysR family transcriptional regulator [Shewanella schlegeliana]MCL1110853.1 LysR substrate-binding domain-containing protein [Shewanella schlegeliana]GIU38968.1 LysR family transcriptional regulator [Shewanella schlegeliana]